MMQAATAQLSQVVKSAADQLAASSVYKEG